MARGRVGDFVHALPTVTVLRKWPCSVTAVCSCAAARSSSAAVLQSRIMLVYWTSTMPTRAADMEEVICSFWSAIYTNVAA